MSENKKLVIWGAGTIGELAHYYFSNDSDYEVIGFTEGDEMSIASQSFLNKPLYKWSEVTKLFGPDEVDIFIAIGAKKGNQFRRQRFDQARASGYRMATYISSKATNFSKKIGDNCFVLENNVLQPFTEVEDCVTMWSGNHIGHHSIIKQNCFICSHVVISGKCVVGSNSFIGVNATIHDGVEIGAFSIVGAGSIVTTSCEDMSLFLPNKTESKVIKRNVI